MGAGTDVLGSLLDRVGEKARASGVFDEVRAAGGRLECRASGSAEPAWYRVELDGGRLWATLAMKDRWLSESIEADLMHTGDKLEELLDEELADQGWDLGPLGFEHFRSEAMEFTFRSALPIEAGAFGEPSSAEAAGQALLAYEACFRNLGDMDAGAGEG